MVRNRFSQLNETDLFRVGGIPHIVKCITDPSPKIRSWSAWIVATLTQNNPNTQAILLNEKIIEKLLSLFPTEEDSEARSKQIFALSSLMTNNPTATAVFVSNGGIPLLVRALGCDDVGTQVSLPLRTSNK